jgi:hypothetical protein
MRLVLILAVIVLAGAGCTSTDNYPREYWSKQLDAPDPKEARFPEEVSLIRLIANPDNFDGRYVRVLGYLHMEFERNAIFIRKEDCDQWLETNSIRIGIAKSEVTKQMRKLSDRYVLLEGRFYNERGASKGTIWRVTRVEPNFTPKNYRDALGKDGPNSEGSISPQRETGPGLNKPVD